MLGRSKLTEEEKYPEDMGGVMSTATGAMMNQQWTADSFYPVTGNAVSQQQTKVESF